MNIEQTAAANVKAKIIELKRSAYDLLRGLEKADARQLQIAGYKSLEEAAAVTVARTRKQIEKLMQDHEKAFPSKESP